MHYFQQRYLRENRAFPNLAGLETIDLPNKGLLSGIEFMVRGTCGVDTEKPDVWLHDRIKKVELIVNGSQVVKSYDARQLLAMMLYKKTHIFSHDAKNISSGAAHELFYINLGRHYHDMEYMLDLSQVSDPELRIEYDFEMTKQNGWEKGKAMTAKPAYFVICHLLRDPTVVPKGYIKTSEIYRFENGPSVQHNMTVARGPMYSNLYLQSWYFNQGLTWIMDHYELNINSDNLIPIRTDPTTLLTALARQYGLFEIDQQCYLKGMQAYPAPMEAGRPDGIEDWAVLDVALFRSDLWANNWHVPFKTVTTGALSADIVNTRMLYRGAMPFSVAAIPLFNPWDEETWIDSSKLGDLWVRVELNDNALADKGICKLLADEVVTKYTTPSYP